MANNILIWRYSKYSKYIFQSNSFIMGFIIIYCVDFCYKQKCVGAQVFYFLCLKAAWKDNLKRLKNLFKISFTVTLAFSLKS